MKLTSCAVEGCTNLTCEASGVCCACRTKIQRGEIRVLPAADYRAQLDATLGGFVLLLVGLAALILAGHFDFAGAGR